MLSVAVNYIINAENLIVVGDQVYTGPGRKLPCIYHGVGRVGKIVVYITCIGKQIDIYSIMYLVKLLHPNEGDGIAIWLHHLHLQIIH